MKKKLVEQIEKNLKKKFNLKKNQNILVAFSGGPDSVFLLYALKVISEKEDFKIGAVHLNHRLRGKSSFRDESFCREFAHEHKISFYTVSKDIKKISIENKISVEDAGRRERYNFFQEIKQKHNYKFIATAHHMDDSVEQVFMNIIRGSGLQGLTGIPPKRDDIIRPLYNIKKSKIIRFLNTEEIDFCIDETNKENIFLRNKIRNLLIPDLEKNFNPEIKNSIKNLIDISSVENDYILSKAEKNFKKTTKIKDSTALINLKDFNRLHNAIKRRVLRLAIKSLKGETLKIELKHVDKIISITNSPESLEIHLPDKIMVKKYYDTLEIISSTKNHRKKRPDPVFLEKILEKPPKTNEEVIYNDEKYMIKISMIDDVLLTEEEKNNDFVTLSLNRLKFPVIIRTIKPGDRFTPANFWGRKKLKKILNEKRLSPFEKERIIVLESQGKIHWISGVDKNYFNAHPENSEKALLVRRVLR